MRKITKRWTEKLASWLAACAPAKLEKKAYFQVEHAVGSPFIEKYLKKELEDKDLMATVSGLDVAFQ